MRPSPRRTTFEDVGDAQTPARLRQAGALRKALGMAEALILEFDGVTAEQYDAVNGALGIDAATGEGDWPTGLLDHTGCSGEHFVVFEVW